MQTIELLGETIAYPETRLENRVLRVAVLTPDLVRPFVGGVRFDRAGVVRRVMYRGHVFFDRILRPEVRPGDPAHFESGAIGTAGEFGTTAPTGFADAKPGETFVKIGVGELRRTDTDEYGFYKTYSLVAAGTWKTAFAQRDGKTFRVVQTHELHAGRGYAYRYETVIELPRADAPLLRITRRLQNTGQKTIQTDHYTHHFAGMDTAPIGADYVLRFPFRAAASVPFDPEAVDFAVREGETVVAPRAVLTKAIYGELAGYPAKPSAHAVVVANRASKTTLHISGDRAPCAIHVWGTDRVLCPELFVPVRVVAGQETRWVTTYRFAAP